MDDLLARLETDLGRVRALYRLARRRALEAAAIGELEALGKTLRVELDRFRTTWDPAERRQAVLAAGRVLGRVDAWVATRGPDFIAVWRNGRPPAARAPH